MIRTEAITATGPCHNRKTYVTPSPYRSGLSRFSVHLLVKPRSLLDQHPGSRSTQRQHLAAVRLLFDSLMMRGVVEYNPAARAKPPRLVRESSHTPVFEEAEIVAFLDSISLDSLKEIRDKAIFCVLLYSWCRVSALINLSVADYYERGGARWLRFQEKRGKEHEVTVHSKAKCGGPRT